MNPLLQKSPAPPTSTQSSAPPFFGPATPQAPKAPTPAKEECPPASKSEPLAKFNADLAKDLTTDKKMEGYLKSLGQKLEELAVGSLKDKAGDPNSAGQLLVSKRIAEEFEKASKDILKDPDFLWAKKRLICFVGHDDLTAFASILTGLAIAYFADVPLKGEKEVKLAPKVAVGGDVDLGTAQKPKFVHAMGFAKIASEHFSLKMGAGYRSEDEAAKLSTLPDTGTQTFRVRAEAFATDKGMQITLSPTLELHRLVRLSGTGAYSTTGGFFGKANLRLGTSATFLDSGVFFKPDGEIVLTAATGKKFEITKKDSLEWKGKFSRDLLSGKTSAEGSLEYTRKDRFSLAIEGNLKLPQPTAGSGIEANSINIFFRMPLPLGGK